MINTDIENKYAVDGTINLLKDTVRIIPCAGWIPSTTYFGVKMVLGKTYIDFWNK